MNFENLSKKVKKFSKDTVTEVQKINEVRQLNGKVNDEKKALEKIYLEMGKKLYDAYKDEPLAGFEEEFQQISRRFTTMDLLQDQIRSVKGVVLCPCCNMEVSAMERFCSNCGTRMPEVAVIEDKVDEDAIEVHSEVIDPEAVAGEAEEEEKPEEESAAEEAETVEEAEEPEEESAVKEAETVEEAEKPEEKSAAEEAETVEEVEELEEKSAAEETEEGAEPEEETAAEETEEVSEAAERPDKAE